MTVDDIKKLSEIAQDEIGAVLEEYVHARHEHEMFHSAHEGFAVLLEEVDELWDEIKRKGRSRQQMRREAVQVCAMALAFLVEV